MVRELFADAYVTLTLDAARGLVRYARSATPYPSLEDVRRVHEAVLGVLSSVPPDARKVLLDLRAAPPRNDPAFEAEVTRALQKMMPRFARRAVLVKSAAGRLQTQRLARERGDAAPAIFDDEADALAHLDAD